MDILSAISGALDRAIRPEQPGRPDWLLEGDRQATERDLESTPKPTGFEKTNRKIETLTKQLAEAAEERERLLGLGRRCRQLRGHVTSLEARLAEAVESIRSIETAAETGWKNAQAYFGDPNHRRVTPENAASALNAEAVARAMREKLMPGLEAEIAAARREVKDFAKKHDLREIEGAEAAVE